MSPDAADDGPAGVSGLSGVSADRAPADAVEDRGAAGIAQRWARCRDAERRILEVIAVLARAVSVPMLAVLAMLSIDATFDAVDSAIEGGWIVEVDDPPKYLGFADPSFAGAV